MADQSSFNHFTLKGHHIEVEYTTNVPLNSIALKYKDNSFSHDFEAHEVTTAETAFGFLVTVPLRRSIDACGITFGFFLPKIPENPQEQIPHFTTVAIREEFGGPSVRRPTTRHSFVLEGTATKVMVPF
jgi:hypothetical protein